MSGGGLAPEHLDSDLAVGGQPGPLHALAVVGLGDVALAVERDQAAVAAQTADAVDGRLGGDGGLIALDREGNIAQPYNSQGMKRAWLTTDGEIGVQVFDQPA